MSIFQSTLRFVSCAVLLVPFCIAGGGQEPSSGSSIELSQEDWGAIRLAREQGQHEVRESADGFEATNPGQCWVTSFDKRGFETEPSGGAWSWGLQLESYGFAGAIRSVSSPESTSVTGNRVNYNWNANLQEWYVNDSRGLEHGYVLQVRPQRPQTGPLMFDITVRGGLRAQALAGGLGAEFLDAAGHQVLTYSGLFVFDANGVAQEALITCTNSGLRIEVNEQDAIYPLTVDPVAFRAYLKASNTDAGDRFGLALAAYGNRVVVGAPFESSSSAGVNGDESDNSMVGAGAVYVFVQSGGQWTQEAYLKASNPDAGDNFGRAVAIASDLIVVGAQLESSAANTIDGNGADNSAHQSGAAYVFEYAAGQWSQTAYLKANNTDIEDRFGFSVAAFGQRVVIGAPYEASNAAFIGGDGADNSYYRAGAAYVFDKAGPGWSQSAYLKAPNSGTYDEFGTAVGLEDNWLLVGAPNERSNAIGINGDMYNDSAPNTGALYSYGWTAAGWAFEDYVKVLNPGIGDQFGSSLAVSGDRVVVGAPRESGFANGVNGNSSLYGNRNAGAAYIFSRLAGAWSQEAYLKATHSRRLEFYGSSVAIYGRHVIVGSSLESSTGVGVNGDDSIEGSPFSGAAYLYERTVGVWEVEAFIKAPDPEELDLFGRSVAVNGGRAYVGVPWEDSASLGLGGDLLDNSAEDSGALFVYEVEATFGTYCGLSARNSTGIGASISVSGSTALLDQTFTLHAIGLPPQQFGFFLSSRGTGLVYNPGGSQGDLCLGGGAFVARHNRAHEIGYSGLGGTLQKTLDLTDVPGYGSVMAGELWNFQCWYRDQNPIHDSNFTNAVAVQFD